MKIARMCVQAECANQMIAGNDALAGVVTGIRVTAGPSDQQPGRLLDQGKKKGGVNTDNDHCGYEDSGQ